VKKDRIISAFAQLGKIMNCLGQNHAISDFELGITPLEFENLNNLISRQVHYNGWFSEDMVRKAFCSLADMLEKEKLEAWAKNYKFNEKPLTVAVIMAGNIPLVGFHDFLCVLLSGNRILCKLSSEDKLLLPALSKILIHLDSDFEGYISFSEGNISNFDAVIATGSTNSLDHFIQYFSKCPHLFRGSRTSLAVITGSESDEELVELGKDLFHYYGRGCRNVSHLLLPENYSLNRIFEAIVSYGEVVNNKKYGNNYDYYKSIHLMNLEKFLDNNFVLVKESQELFSPLAMIYYSFYSNENDAKDFVTKHEGNIQCIVGSDFTPFGKAQAPGLADYADTIDTMAWLENLRV
jgi:hypothetical protein